MIQPFISENEEIDLHEIFPKFKYAKIAKQKLRIDYDPKLIIAQITELKLKAFYLLYRTQ